MRDEPTAVLTSSQRKYLRGEAEPAQKRTMETRIRERVRASAGDFELLMDHHGKVTGLDIELMPLMAFALGQLLLDPSPPDAGPSSTLSQSHRIQWTEFQLNRAIDRAAEAYDTAGGYKFDISPPLDGTRSVAEIARFVELGSYTIQDILELQRKGEISREKYLAVAEWLASEDNEE